MIKHKDSHLDHLLTPAQVEFLLERFKDRDGSFAETIEFPPELGTVPCSLHGPIMGDDPIPDEEVFRIPRGVRTWSSRLTSRRPRPVRQVTVIAGPHDGHACVLYTAFGGPLAPQEPGDPTCKDVAASSEFWAAHALSV